MFCRIVSFIIHGVCEQNATPDRDCGVIEPRFSVVSPIILPSKVDFPDATDPVIAVKPWRIFKLRSRRTSSDASRDQDMSACSKETRIPLDISGDRRSLSSAGSCGNSEDGDNGGGSVDDGFFEKYASILLKHETAWKKVGSAWQKVSSGLVRRLIRENDVNAWAESSVSSFLTTAMTAYAANVTKGATVVGMFAGYMVKI